MKSAIRETSRGGTILDRWLEPRGADAALTSVIVLLLILAVTAVVYLTGGIKFVYSHAMYLPILLGAITHRIRGGILAALVAGILLGPWMPLDTLTGDMQLPTNWLFRLAAFTVIGVTSGAAVQSLRNRLDRERWLATHDSTTPLGNITYLEEAGAAHQAAHPAATLDVIVIEASNMTHIVGTFGMEWADRIIEQLADAIESDSENLVALARYQTAKLALIGAFPDSDQLEDQMLEFMHQGSSTYSNGDLTVFVELLGGAARLTPESGTSVLSALRQADGALEHARLKGRTASIYSPEEDQSNREAVARIGQLKRALREGELRLYFHPKVCTRTRRTLSLEALLRWEHPTEGMIPPSLFIPYAEGTSLISDLTDWVIAEALSCLKAWRDQGFDIAISANASARDLKGTTFCQRLRQHLENHQTTPESFELEITESAIMHEPEKILDQLAGIRNLRVALSIDDFGTGYSSMAYLGMIPAATLKIDQAFVSDLGKDPGAAAITRAATQLAHDFGMRAVAEGVETAELFEKVAELGVDEAQGYYFTKPIPAHEVADWLASSPWPAPRQPVP